MTQYKRIAIDTSKSVFTPRGIDPSERPLRRVNLSRAQLIPFFRKLPPPRSRWKPAAAAIIGAAN
jgi:hypothetical protein